MQMVLKNLERWDKLYLQDTNLAYQTFKEFRRPENMLTNLPKCIFGLPNFQRI